MRPGIQPSLTMRPSVLAARRRATGDSPNLHRQNERGVPSELSPWPHAPRNLVMYIRWSTSGSQTHTHYRICCQEFPRYNACHPISKNFIVFRILLKCKVSHAPFNSVVIAFSSRARNLGECSTIHSLPALFSLKSGD